MKSLMIAASLAALSVAAPALAQDNPVTVYGTVGYANTDADGVNLGAIQGRIGARYGQYLGLEGELAGGVKSDEIKIVGTRYDVDLNYQAAVYGVGYLPVAPNADLFARVGYGKSKIDVSGPFAAGSADGESWNYGVGGQYFFTEKDGVRVDLTRHDFDNGGDADVVGVSYVRKF
ncbi:MAG: porin family protein [Caulobacter sp.]|nr:porin family protein [Caulobacter sp.]